MKRKKILTLLLICPLLLTACTNDNAITAVYNYDIEVVSDPEEYFIDIDVDQVLNLINADNEFILLIHNSNCHTCQTAMPHIEEYLESVHQSVYRYEGTTWNDFCCTAEDTRLIEAYPEIFLNEDSNWGYPRMFTIKNKEIAYELPLERMMYKTSIKSSLKQCTEFSHIYYCSKMAAYNLFIEEFGECEPIIYNTETEDGCITYREEFINAQSKSTPTLFVDEAEAEDELKIALGIEVVTSEDEAIEEAEEE